MWGLPPIPSWDGLHPLIVHFPVALLLVAPLFVVAGLLKKEWARGFMTAALVLMALGTLATFVAVPTGEAAAKLADRTPEINAVIQRHEELAETSRILFTALTVIFAVMVFLPGFLKKEMDRVPALVLHGAFLILYAVGALAIANTAHNGGRLVHEFGVRALMDAPAQGQTQTQVVSPTRAAEANDRD